MPDPDDSRVLLRCPACGRSVPFTPADEALALLHGWPQCCGQGMVPVADAPEADAGA